MRRRVLGGFAGAGQENPNVGLTVMLQLEGRPPIPLPLDHAVAEAKKLLVSSTTDLAKRKLAIRFLRTYVGRPRKGTADAWNCADGAGLLPLLFIAHAGRC